MGLSVAEQDFRGWPARKDGYWQETIAVAKRTDGTIKLG